jgi:eukaryotic-like serine/threonine-protein kinase
MGRVTGEVPDHIDRYQVVERVGKGGMAQVFHARLQGLGGFERDVALKVLLPEYAAEPDFIDMLLDEARIAGAILHPCVLQVLDVGRQSELFYIVMEYVDGSDLRSILKSAPGGRLKPATALHLVGEVLRGLDAVHSAVDRQGKPRRIVHRDVSPANVMVDRSGVVKLGDFGIAHATSRLTRTRNGAVKGKLRYMAPEQVAAQPVDHRADLYSVGIMLCEMVLGPDATEPRRPGAHGPMFVWTRSLGGRSLPADIGDILDRALAVDPNRRYASAAHFHRDVSAALHRRHAGYGGSELAHDLGMMELSAPAETQHTELATDPQTPVPSPFDVSDGDALFSEEQKPTAPFRQITAPFPRSDEPPPLAQPYAPLGDISLRGTPWKKVGIAAAGGAAALLSVVIAVALGTSSSAAPMVATPVAAAAPVALPLPVAKPATGTLSVEGPRGATVMIGSTAYPPAPCRLELPAGQYQVKVRAGRRQRFVTRSVDIQPGRSVLLRI